jgi:PKD repeat protein
MVWAIRPSVVTVVAVGAPVSSETHSVHTYAGAGTYTVKLTVVDNLGASSMTTKAVTVS